MARSTRLLIAGLVAAGAGMAAPAAVAQQRDPFVAAAPARSAVPQRDTLLKLTRRVTLSVEDQRLEDVVQFIRDFTSADIEPAWADSRYADGLDRDRLVSVRVDGVSALTFIEKVLEKASDGFGTNSWQLSPTGTLEIGPKSRLNRHRRVEVYDINDLLLVLPRYEEVPEIDLNSVLQSSQGGGGGQSPFREQDNQRPELPTKEERAKEIIDILIALVEPEQWEDNGGDGASLRYWQGHVIVNAPDYIHRQIDGYPYWPARLTRSGVANGRRYVSLNLDTGISTIDRITQHPVAAVVNGEVISSDPGGGG
jgi:hypothetical protein